MKPFQMKDKSHKKKRKNKVRTLLNLIVEGKYFIIKEPYSKGHFKCRKDCVSMSTGKDGSSGKQIHEYIKLVCFSLF